MKPIHYKGFTCLVEREVLDDDPLHKDVNDTIPIEMWFVGSMTAVRSVTSALIGNTNRKRASEVFYESGELHIPPKLHYNLEIHASRVQGVGIATRCKIIFAQATNKFDDVECKYIVTERSHRETEPPPHFLQHLTQSVRLPLKEEWTPWLWSAGLEPITTTTGSKLYKPLITEIPGDRLYAYRLSHNANAWMSLVRRQLDLVHTITYNRSIGKVWSNSLADERLRYATQDPRWPQFQYSIDADGKDYLVRCHIVTGEQDPKLLAEGRALSVGRAWSEMAQLVGLEMEIKTIR